MCIIPIFVCIFKWFLWKDNRKKREGRSMVIFNYQPLWKTMEQKNITTYTLIFKHDIPSKTMYNLKHNKSITMYTVYAGPVM